MKHQAKIDKLKAMASPKGGDSKGNPKMPKLKQIASPKGESKGNPKQPKFTPKVCKSK